MDILFISTIALIGSILSFFSGFGLGTILLPAFLLFFPLQVAVGLTATVHLLNNFFKIFLVGRYLNKTAFLLFSLPSIPGAFIGAYLLFTISNFDPMFTYTMNAVEYKVEPIKAAIAILMIGFALFELFPKLSNWTVDKKYLPLGGILSGFFGGLSGHQGALRSVFLVRAGLSKESFIGTGVVTACLIDLIRLSVYGTNISSMNLDNNLGILIGATTSAFIGAYLGSKLLKKITLRAVQMSVAALLLCIAVLLGAGII